MKVYGTWSMILITGGIAAAIIGFMLVSQSEEGSEWHVAEDGMLEYSLPEPEYQLGPCVIIDNSTLCEVVFESRDAEIAGLLRRPQADGTESIPGVVLLPGATVTKEMEQGLAKYLSSLGMASITIDQRNLGRIDIQGDLQKFLQGKEPTEHKMVHDALVAAEILRSLPGIDKNRTIYAGESNGARFAIIACSLDSMSRGAIAISTCGYGADEAAASGKLDSAAAQFYRSIDPETYLGRISPRKLAMFHSLNDPIIPYEYANRTYEKSSDPKEMHTVECAVHGHCQEMDISLKNEIDQMVL